MVLIVEKICNNETFLNVCTNQADAHFFRETNDANVSFILIFNLSSRHLVFHSGNTYSLTVLHLPGMTVRCTVPLFSISTSW